MTLTLAPRVPSPSYGGIFSAHQPRIIVCHSTESAMGPGTARAVASYLSRRTDGSVHYVVGPDQIIPMVPETNISWGAGNVNPSALHVEFCGRAAFTRAEWTTPDGLAMLRLGGALIADIAARHGIPLRWLTDSQLLAAWKGLGPGGLTTHAQCTRVIGGTTHTDPGPNYPTDLLLEYAKGGAAATKPPTVPEEDDMPFTEAQLRAIVSDETEKTVRKLLTSEKLVAYSDQRLRPAKDLSLSITGALGRSGAYDSNASGGIDQLARAQGLEPEDRK